jgi:endonuclease YncB( thermonuclease family)
MPSICDAAQPYTCRRRIGNGTNGRFEGISAEGIQMRPILLLVLAVVALAVCTNASLSSSDDKKPDGAGGKPTIAKEQVRGGIVFPAEKRMWTRLAGKVTVIDANTLRFEDGTEVCVSGSIDAPELEQQALLGESFYPCGKEAAAFLKTLIREENVTFLGDRRGEERADKHQGGSCFVGETNLGIELVRNGWALSHHSGMDAWEIIAREHKRGLWRGEFVVPERWRRGERLPGE